MKELYVYHTHGDEAPPEEITSRARFSVVANKKARDLGVRFVETDLNRSFGKEKPESHEEKLAEELKPFINLFDRVYDIHRTTADTKFCAIITDIKNYGAALRHKPEAVVIIAMPGALISHVKCGVGLEYPYGEYGHGSGKDDTPVYEVTGMVTAREGWKDFEVIPEIDPVEGYGDVSVGQLITVGDKADLYPYLCGEKAYDGKCFIMRKIK